MISRGALHAFRAVTRRPQQSPITHAHAPRRFNTSTTNPQRRFSKGQRRVALITSTAVGGVAFGWWDDRYNDRTVTRNLRTAYHGLMIAADYKLNFDSNSLESINALHERASNRLLQVCEKNRSVVTPYTSTLIFH